jgi:hypothetical protein
MTVNVYGHLVPAINRQAVDKLDDPGYSGSGAVATGRKDDPKYLSINYSRLPRHSSYTCSTRRF